MATSYSNVVVDPYTTIDTAPNRYSTLTGTISTDGRYVTGIGTLFTTEIGGGVSNVGSPTKVASGYIFNGTNEIREIVSVVSDTNLVLDAPFTVNLSGVALKFIPDSRTMQMSWVCISAGGKVDNVTLAAGEGSGVGLTASAINRVVKPVVVDGASGQINVTKYLSD